MHVADFQKGMLGACGIVGGGIPIGVGAALTIKLRHTSQVAVCFFGDGASNEGSFHESVNFAAALNLPVIFLVENNGYGEFTPQKCSMRIEYCRPCSRIWNSGSGCGRHGCVSGLRDDPRVGTAA